MPTKRNTDQPHKGFRRVPKTKKNNLYEFNSEVVQKCGEGRTWLLLLTLAGLFIALGHFQSVKHNYFALHALKLIQRKGSDE